MLDFSGHTLAGSAALATSSRQSDWRTHRLRHCRSSPSPRYSTNRERASSALNQALVNLRAVDAPAGEFTVLLGNTTAAQARLIADELADAIEATSLDVGGRQVSVGASIGVIAIDRTVESGDTALIDADRAMYRTKRARTGRHGLGGL